MVVTFLYWEICFFFLLLGDCQLFQAVGVQLSPTRTKQAVLIVFVYLMYEVYVQPKWCRGDPYTSYVGLFPLTAAKTEFSSYHISSNKRRTSNKYRFLMSGAPLGIHIETSVSL